MIKEIVFDFDGTLALTFDLSVKIISGLGYGKVTDKQIKVFRNEGWRKALKGVDFPMWKLPATAIRVQKEMNERINEVKMVEGLKEILIDLEKKGLVLGILTSNNEKNVKKFLKMNGLDMFRYIYSDKSIFGKEKRMKDLLKERGLKKEEIIYVGDEVRDWEACQKVGVKMIGVGWGFNDKKFFKEAGLEKIADKPKEIMTLI